MSEVCDRDVEPPTINRLLSAATEDASEAMCKWTSGQITLSLDEVCEATLEEMPRELDFGDELLTMVVHCLEGDLGGQLILTFDEQNGRQLAASLLGREVSDDPEWSELEKSALCETGNILSGAYMKVLTEAIDAKLVPSAPYFIQDYGASILQQAVVAQAMISDRVLICRTNFQRAGESLKWNVFFVPTEDLLEKLEHPVKALA